MTSYKRRNRGRAGCAFAEPQHRRPRLENLERRELLAADLLALDAIPEPHAYLSLHDYHGSLLPNWQEILASHDDAHSHGEGGDNRHDGDCDHDGDGCTCHLSRSCPVHGSGAAQVSLADNTTSGGLLTSSEFSANYKWPQSSLGAPTTITYSYSNLLDGNLGGSLTDTQLRGAVEEAFGLWASVAPLHFVELVDAGPPISSNDTSYLAAGTPDIRIGHTPQDGPSGTLGYAYYPTTTFWGIAGDVHLDSGEFWKLGAGGGIDIVEVMTHEIGHALGLGHEETSPAIMNPFYGGRYSVGNSFLLSDDINGIRALYGAGTGSVTPLHSEPIPTNSAPTLAAIADQTISGATDSVTVTLEGTDPDGDAITYQATLVHDPLADTAYQLDQQESFLRPTNEAYNYRGLGEKYLQNARSEWFYILGNGELYRWGGSIASSTLETTLSADYHTDLSRLYDAQPATAGPGDVNLSLVGDELTIEPASTFAGTIHIETSVSDGELSSSEDFRVIVTNSAPVVDPIADQTLSPNQDSLTITVGASDADGDAVTLSAEAVQLDPVHQTAALLRQQHGFYPASTTAENYRGAGEKYFLGSGNQWYYILPNGRVHRWGGSLSASPQVGQLDATYHSNLGQLFGTESPQATTAPVTLSWNGNQLTIDPDAGYAGPFTVEVSASDGRVSTTESFSVEVINHAPTIVEIADQIVSQTAGSITVSVDANDDDGDALIYSAVAMQSSGGDASAYELSSQYGFRAAPTEAYNYRGAGEKYFYGNGNQWFYMLPTGAIYRWGGSLATSTPVGSVDANYHSDLTQLYNVQQPTVVPLAANLNWLGNDLTIDLPNGFAGQFEVTISVSDTIATTETSFQIEVRNVAPTIAAVAAQSISYRQDTLTVSVPMTDGDGDSITRSATAWQVDELAQTAFELRQQHGFRPAAAEYTNYRGVGEKYFYGNGNQWYYMLPNGQIFRWRGSLASSTLVGTLDSSYHANLSELYHATESGRVQADVDFSWSGDDLTIDPAEGVIGDLQIEVTADDGAESTTHTFDLTVTSSPPQIAPIADVSLATNQDSITITISATDADGDAIVLSATASQSSALEETAFQLQSQYQFRPAAAEYTNYRGAGEKYFYGNGNQWFYMLPNGDIYRWGGSLGLSALVGSLDGSYHANLSQLYGASQPQATPLDGQLSWNGNQLIIERPDNFSGAFTVTVEATAGGQTTSLTFNVNVAPAALTAESQEPHAEALRQLTDELGGILAFGGSRDDSAH